LLNSISPRVVPVGVLQNTTSSTINILAIAIPSTTSNIQNTVGSVETAASGEIEALIPRNYSFSTKKFYVGFKNHTNCNDLLLDISKIIPPEITNITGDKIQAL
jgi:hypothetical protein